MLHTTVAIIGTANRDRDPRMTAAMFERMVEAAHDAICAAKLAPERVQLVSGGAAWADHVAVRLFRSSRGYKSLRLCLPAPWDPQRKQYDTATQDGARSNQLHRSFSSCVGDDTLAELHETTRVASHRVFRGFKARNKEVATSALTVALTWGSGQPPSRSGTGQTWRMCGVRRKRHIDLASLVHTSKKRARDETDDDAPPSKRIVYDE
jgi:hypothetical protein